MQNEAEKMVFLPSFVLTWAAGQHALAFIQNLCEVVASDPNTHVTNSTYHLQMALLHLVAEFTRQPKNTQ